jgi:hypothetical protein
MIGWTRARGWGLAAAALAATGALALTASSAFAETEVVYNNLPAVPPPGNVTSLGFEATQTSQFGGAVELAGTARKGGNVFVGMSSFACQTGSWTGTPECQTERGARFEMPVLLRVYEEEPNGEPGRLLGSQAKSQKMPYRPSENRLKCVDSHGQPEGGWFQKGTCYHGKYFKISFSLPHIVWPARVLLSVQYDTSDYGPKPFRPQPCNSQSGGCFYDSLNVGLAETSPAVGSYPQPNDAYQDTKYAPYWCDGGAGGTGVFRLDAGCWAPYQPMFEIKAGQ